MDVIYVRLVMRAMVSQRRRGMTHRPLPIRTIHALNIIVCLEKRLLSAFAIFGDRLLCSVRQDVRFLFYKITSRPRAILNLTQTSYASIDRTMRLAPCRILIRSGKGVRPGKTVLDGPRAFVFCGSTKGRYD